MATIEVRLDGIDRILRKLSPDLFDPALQRLIEQATLLAEREARLGVTRDTGATARSLTSEVTPLQGRVYSTAISAVVEDQGRRAGARMPPPNALAGWARRHGFASDPGTLFVLARSIGRRGRKGRFFMQKAADKVRRALPGLADDAVAEIKREWER
jgi:hypothetical protein